MRLGFKYGSIGSVSHEFSLMFKNTHFCWLQQDFPKTYQKNYLLFRNIFSSAKGHNAFDKKRLRVIIFFVLLAS